jgi:hypothetical protein
MAISVTITRLKSVGVSISKPPSGIPTNVTHIDWDGEEVVLVSGVPFVASSVQVELRNSLNEVVAPASVTIAKPLITQTLADIALQVVDQDATPYDNLTIPVKPQTIQVDRPTVPITINTAPFAAVKSGDPTLNIPVVDTEDANVGSIVGGKQVIPDSTAVLRDSTPATLRSVVLKAGETKNIPLADSTVNIRRSDNTVIEAKLVKAEATDDATVADSTVIIRKSDNSIIEAKTVKADDTADATVADSVITNDPVSPTYTANVKATDGLVLPDQQIDVNSVNEGSIPSVGGIDINITDGVNPVTPNSVGIVGRTVTVEVPSGGGSPSGVLLHIIQPEQNTSYGTYDIGWRRQNGWFDYVPPAYPEVIAELDYTSANYHFTLKNSLRVRSNASVRRFVDADGLQEFPATNNKDLVVFDKLTGLISYRDPHSLGTFANRQAAFDFAQTININVDGIVLDDWYMVGYNELLAILGQFLVPRGAGNNLDPVTSKVIFTGPTANHNVQTAFTNVIFGGTNILGYRATTTISYQAVVGTDYAFFIHKGFNLITAP